MKVFMWPFDEGLLINDYTKILGEGIRRKGFKVQRFSLCKYCFSWRAVLHIHWPETYLGSSKCYVRVLGSVFVLFVLFWSRVNRTRVVWTVHNVYPHDSSVGFFSRLFYRLLKIFVDKLLFLSECSREKLLHHMPYFGSIPYKVSPHIFYPDAGMQKMPAEASGLEWPYLLFWGMIKPYKNVTSLVIAYGECEFKSEFGLLIAGRFMDQTLKSEVADCARNISNIMFIDKFLDSEEISWLLNNCLGVVLPYKDITNSGALYHSLSASKKILVPRNQYFEEQSRFHGGKIILYENNISSDDIDQFYQECRILDEGSADNIKVYNEKIFSDVSKFYLS